MTGVIRKKKTINADKHEGNATWRWKAKTRMIKLQNAKGSQKSCSKAGCAYGTDYPLSSLEESNLTLYLNIDL